MIEKRSTNIQADRPIEKLPKAEKRKDILTIHKSSNIQPMSVDEIFKSDCTPKMNSPFIPPLQKNGSMPLGTIQSKDIRKEQ